MRGDPVTFASFAGGVNAQAAPYSLDDNEARDARNVQSTITGAIAKRGGSSLLSSFGAAVRSLAGFTQGSTRFLVATGGTEIKSISPAGTASSIKGALSLTSGLQWEFAQAVANGGQGPLFGLNGTDQPIYWTGAGNAGAWTTTAGSIPAGAKFPVWHGNRMWIASGSRIYWSALGNPRDWPAANVTALDESDGQDITGIGTIGPYVVVFKAAKTFIVYDLNTSANRRVSGVVGAVSHRSITETPNGTAFLGRDGVYRTDGQSVERISDRIKPFIDDISSAKASEAAGVYSDRHYYLSVSTGGVANDLTLDFDLTLNCWWLHTLAASQWTVAELAAGQPYLYGGVGSYIDRGFIPGVYTDPADGGGAATAFEAYWYGAFHALATPYVRKRVRWIHFDGKGRFTAHNAKDFARAMTLLGEVDFSESETTFGGSGTFGGEGTFGGAASLGEQKLYSLGVARVWSFGFSSSSDNDMEIDSYTIGVTARRN
jgi:hypothetical protein